MMLEVQGKPRHYRPGDWLDVSRQTAVRWIAEGKAISPRPINELLPNGSGVVLIDAAPEIVSQIERLSLDFTLSDRPVLPYARTLIIRDQVDLRSMLFPAGFNLLERWQVVAPLYSYDVLATHIGSEKERAATAKIIRDLRVPVYDTRLLFVRKCADTLKLLDTWYSERKSGSDQRLSFMRAFYKVKPLLCAAPVSWIDRTFGA